MNQKGTGSRHGRSQTQTEIVRNPSWENAQHFDNQMNQDLEHVKPIKIASNRQRMLGRPKWYRVKFQAAQTENDNFDSDFQFEKPYYENTQEPTLLKQSSKMNQ